MSINCHEYPRPPIPTFTLMPSPEDVVGVSPETLKRHKLQISLGFADRIRVYQNGEVVFQAAIKFTRNERGGWTADNTDAVAKTRKWIEGLGDTCLN